VRVYDLCSGAIVYSLPTDGFISAIALYDQYLAAGLSVKVISFLSLRKFPIRTVKYVVQAEQMRQ
jgi:hypothetical protein